MNKQQQALLIVIVCIAILLITTSMIYIRGLKDKNENLKTQNAQLKEQIKIMEGDIKEINQAYQKEIDRLTGKPLGNFVTTFYCPTGNRTSTGTIPKEGRTIAVDPKVIAPGSTVRIEHNGRSKIYKVEDSGVSGRVIDTFIESEKQAVKLGVKKIKVYLVEE
jgi:3D (Asp-Asp-Asp) domain-containing protein